MGTVYREQLLQDRVRLRSQMQAYAACGDPEIETVVRNGYSDLVTYVEQVAGDLPTEEISRVLRDRDAPERDRVDGAATAEASRGRAAARGLRQG